LGDGTTFHQATNWSQNTIPTATIDTNINVPSSNPTIVIDQAESLNSLKTNELVSITPTGSLTLAQNSSFTNGFSLAGPVTLSAGGGKTIKTNTISFSGIGKLDLKDNALIVDYTGATPLSTIIGNIMTARAADAFGNASWTGNGLTSTTAQASPFGFALGVVDNSALGAGAYATFFTQPVDSTSILVRYTRNGDTDLSGTANSVDFTSLATSFNQSSKTWINGDFNFNGVVNGVDFNALATNYGLSGAPPPAPPLSEPAAAPPAPPAGASLFSDHPIAGDVDPVLA